MKTFLRFINEMKIDNQNFPFKFKLTNFTNHNIKLAIIHLKNKSYMPNGEKLDSTQWNIIYQNNEIIIYATSEKILNIIIKVFDKIKSGELKQKIIPNDSLGNDKYSNDENNLEDEN